MTSSAAIILTHPEDWEKWIDQVRAKTDKDIWKHLDPDKNQPEQSLLEMPKRPEAQDFSPNATSYAQLSAGPQKAYDNARKYYDQDLKYYHRQEDLLRSLRSYISDHVSAAKQLLLNPTLTEREWLVKLKESTKPTDNFMKRKALQQYTESLKGPKAAKANQWIDNWEHAMVMAVKYDIPQMSLGVWLQDLAQAIKPLSETYSVLYSEQANDEEKSKSSEYQKVAIKLREAFHSIPKKPATTARGSAFNADFGEDPTGENENRGKGGSRNRKRAGTNSVNEEANATKKSKNKCPACDYKGHDLQDCWALFEDKRPEGYKATKASEARAKKAKERVAQDKELTAQVEKIRQQEGDGDEA